MVKRLQIGTPTAIRRERVCYLLDLIISIIARRLNDFPMRVRDTCIVTLLHVLAIM